jgi:small GTP-binding protein
MLGESSVGKSSILNKFAYGQFQPGSLPTVSPHFVCKIQTIYRIGGQKVKFKVWDTAGQEKYRCLTQMYFRDAKVALIVYDVTNRRSFDCVEYWFKEIEKAN